MTYHLAEAYLHGFDPFAIQFPAGWPLDGIRWYGVAYLAGFAVAWLLIRGLATKHRTTIPDRIVPDLMIYILMGVLIGGRVGYCVFYDPALLIEITGDFPYWGVLAIHKGGMASHGGMLGVIIAGWVFAVRNHISKLHLLDVTALACPPGLFFGRLANFINAELKGTPLPERMQVDTPWWSIKYPDEILTWGAEKEAALRASLGAVIPGDKEFLPNVVKAAADGNQQVIATLQPLLTAYYPSQLIQALTDGPLLLAVLVLVWWKPRKPGVVGGWFLISYGVMRILTEFVRQPDEGVAGLATPLGEFSRGQLLSGLMVLIGAVALVIVSRREVDPIGGLVKVS